MKTLVPILFICSFAFLLFAGGCFIWYGQPVVKMKAKELCVMEQPQETKHLCDFEPISDSLILKP